jgi:hypothetical protein
MKRRRIPIYAFLLLASIGLSQLAKAEPALNEKEQIQKLMQRWDKALVDRDMAFIDAILAEDFTYIGSSGQVQNKAEHLASVKSPDLKIGSSSSNNFGIRIYGDAAVAIAEGRITGSYKSKEFDNHYRYTDILIRRNGKWLVVNTQITDLP